MNLTLTIHMEPEYWGKDATLADACSGAAYFRDVAEELEMHKDEEDRETEEWSLGDCENARDISEDLFHAWCRLDTTAQAAAAIRKR